MAHEAFWETAQNLTGLVKKQPRAHICHEYQYIRGEKLSCGEILGNFGKFGEILPQFTRFHVEKNSAQKYICGKK